ncbi:PAS domain-containing sensor histidine kinase [Maridesulfovibrio hydrothermalis]|uniref:histidine kinase n=1 Tax=Maridesulfovibrio hydrothermalis AM13 = DSM 14728 TaxID=1121451 RepID=L0RB08_9BACT|nr:ATP-binding protein [Maridesulfovibrio hydrothermalis]CCO23953.1 Signal transduction histidine kinase, nitrogen specific, NtrB [Maridesulfovibrio hydrothermalis AM13 = DSM 14728]
MKFRSIHKLNNRIRNYLYFFLTIFIASSLLSFVLFFWSVLNEVDDKAETWASYFQERISFLETVITSRATFDHGLTSILKVTPKGEVLNSRPYPTTLKSIAESKLFAEIKDLLPGEVRLINIVAPDTSEHKNIYLTMRLDHSFAVAEVPSQSLLPVYPRNTELFIIDKNNNCVFHTRDEYNFRDDSISGMHFSAMHVFASAKIFTPEFGGFTIVLAKDISAEFYAGILLVIISATCLAILLKRSSFLTWDLAKNEEDFARIGKLMGRVSSMPDKKLTHLPAIEYTAERIREVNWEEEAANMSFTENIGYVKATAFFAKNILELLDEISAHSKELKRSQKEYMDLVQVARSIILRIDLEGKCTFFNEYAQTFFGFSKEEIVGKNIVGTIIPKTADGQSELECLMKDLVSIPEQFPVHTNQNVRKNGSKVWVFWSNTPVYNIEGEVIEVLAVGTDVTKQKMAEAELERTKNYIKNIIDSMPSIIIGLNSEGKVTHFNSAAEKMAAIPVQDITGAAVSDAFPSISQYTPRICKATETGVPETGIRTQDILKPGTHQDIIIYPLNDGTKSAVIRIDDATERVHIEEMMIQSEKMMSIGGLAAGMAHEINNPLGGILQGIQNIVRRISPGLPANRKAAEKAGCTLESLLNYMEDRKIIKTLNGITESGIRAADIVSGMLEFSRKSDSRKAPGDMRLIMNKATTLATQDYNPNKKYDFKKINIIKEYDENLNLVKCTATEIEQVFLNILRNSAQAMAEWKEMKEKPEISIKIYNLGDMVRCSISDNGPGMNEQIRKRVFEPFYTTKSPGSGTGLGLSVSYFIITQNHMGKFDVQSKPGIGTTFTILMPAFKSSKT